MDKRLLEIYINKYVKGKLNFHGIILTPEIREINGSNLLFWDIENPNDLSYTLGAVYGAIESSLEDFFELTSYKIKPDFRRRYIRKTFINIPDLNSQYISSEFDNELEKRLFKKQNIKDGNYNLVVKVKKFYISTFDVEISLEADVTLYEMYDSENKIPFTETKIKQYFKDTYDTDGMLDLSSVILSEGEDLIFNTPTFYDREESYVISSVNFYSPKGEKVF